ncbi:4Fe-4S dicluster domain-containing protein [Chloroflexota bacterium]
MASSKIISKENIAKLLNEWNQEFDLFVPSRDEGVAKFAKWDGKDTSFLSWYRNTIIPSKTIFFPPMEEIFSFQKDKQSYHIELPSSNGQRQLSFAIRPCDANAMAILDKTFENAYEDHYYLSKRKDAVLVGLGCTRPYDSCFCTSLVSSPTDSTNVDLMLTDIDDRFFVEAITYAGNELVAKTGNLIKRATKADDTRAKEAKDAAHSKVTRRLDTKDIDGKLLSSFEDQDFWKELAAKCISCGICTFLCPTCYCFDINDELIKDRGTRFRSWDSCNFPVYTKMPMENPREEKWRRIRNRVCHKYEFYPMNFDIIACTGCGRCIRQCPVNWDITQTLERIPAKTQS